MSWKAKIFKPDWESRKAEKRLQSVIKDNDQGLWNALPGIISSDPDYEVRLAGLKRLTSNKPHDPLKRFEFMLAQFNALPAKGETDDREQYQYFEKFKQQLTQHIQRDLLKLTIDTEVAANYLADNASPKEIEALAKRASSINVRLAAIGKISANGLLGDIAIKEKEASLRRLAVSRIEQTSTLERVAKALRTRDKKLYQQIQERLFDSAEHNATETADHEAEEICRQLEQMLKAASSGVHPAPAPLVEQWNKMNTVATPPLQQRYQTLLKTITTTLDGSAVRTTPTKATTTTEKPEKDVVKKAEDKPEKPVKAELKSEAKKAAIETKNLDREKREAARQQQQNDAQLAADNINTKQDQLATAIEAVNLKQAVKLLQSIRKDLSSLRKNRLAKSYFSALDGRQSRLHGKVKSLRDYQHWANNKIRSEMIEELQSMSTVDMHPDAVKNTISDARKKWQTLEASEQLPGDKYFHAPASLWREFNQTCDLAFKLIQPFLEKRHEIQDEHLREDQQLLAAGKEILQADENSTQVLMQHQRKLRTAIRELDKIPAKQRGKTARLIRNQLDGLQKEIGAAFEDIATEKSRLIRQAEQLVHTEDKQQAINQAKQLQRQWQAAGSGSRKKEQPLWETFRSHIDPLFKEQAEQQNAAKEASRQQTSQLKDLCSQLESIAKLDATELITQSGRVQSLQHDWQESGGTALRHDHKLNLRFQAAVDGYQKALQASRSQQLLLVRKNWQIKDSLLMKLLAKLASKPEKSKDSIAKTLKKWPTNESSDTIDKLLDAQLQKIQQQVKEDNYSAEQDSSESSQAQYRDLCLTLEYLAGLESPKTEKQNRMDMQIKRLAENLSGEVLRMPLAEEVSKLETSWYQLPMIPEDIRSGYGKRFNFAIDELLTQINS